MEEWDTLAAASKIVRVVDAGAGVGELGKNLTKAVKREHGPGKVIVHSYDSVATPPWVAVGNSAALPEAAGSQDVMTFCLSLMGTNWASYMIEAFRVLRPGGLLLIAEVTSRLQQGAEGISMLIDRFADLGFDVQGTDFSPNPFFTAWAFTKGLRRERPRVLDTDQDLLQPCIYKRR
jgi:ribosomal RNA-processing protein 8